MGAAAKDAGDTVATAARRVRGPMLAAGVTAAGLAGGVALGSRLGGKRRRAPRLLAPRPRVLGLPFGRKSGALRTAEALREGAKHLNSATSQASGITGDVRELRHQLEKMNHQSPIEVVLEGLTHRHGKP